MRLLRVGGGMVARFSAPFDDPDALFPPLLVDGGVLESIFAILQPQ